MTSLQDTIEAAFEDRANISPQQAPESVRRAVQNALDLLESGQARVAEPLAQGGW